MHTIATIIVSDLGLDIFRLALDSHHDDLRTITRRLVSAVVVEVCRAVAGTDSADDAAKVVSICNALAASARQELGSNLQALGFKGGRVVHHDHVHCGFA